MKQGTTEIPGTNPGASSPQSPFSFEDFACISGEHFRQYASTLPATTDDGVGKNQFKAWIKSLPEKLSTTGQQVIASWWAFDLLSEVYNCGAAHTQVFGREVDHTRHEHCIHAAYLSHQLLDRALITLSDYERTVLELVMLLHDPHRLGSHALDRVFASLPGAPAIQEWGWGEDFHEYHGAQEVYRDKDLRAILGEYWPDVLAVLSYPDTRSPEDPSRIRDFGPSPLKLPHGHREPLSKERVNLLYQLKDEIDRMSYLELDFRRSGFDSRLVQGLLACIREYQEHMVTFGNNLAVVLPRRDKGAAAQGGSGYPFDPIVAARQIYREQVASHSASCLVDAQLQHALTQHLREKFQDRMDSVGCYTYFRNIALEGSYHKLFGTSVLEVLRAPRSNNATLGLEDLYAPLVTLTREDLKAGPNGTLSLNFVSLEKSQATCGFPRTDMTQLEHDLRQHLRRQGLDSEIFVILSNDFEKILEYKCLESPENVAVDDFLKTLEKRDNKLSPELVDVVRFAVRSSPKSEKLIIAMRALDGTGASRNLRPVQVAVEDFFLERRLLKDPASLATSYNPRVFCDPLVPQIFRPDVQQRMKDFQPAWITRGGCGLRHS